MGWIDTECAYCGEIVWRISYPSWESRKQGRDRYCSKDCSNKAQPRGAVKDGFKWVKPTQQTLT